MLLTAEAIVPCVVPVGGMEIDYQQYIDGKKEIAQLNAEYRANTMIGH